MLEYGSQAQFAQQYGYSRAAVTQFKQANRLVFKSDGVLDFAASKQKIHDTSDPARKASTDRHKMEREKRGMVEPEKQESHDTGNAFHNAKTVKEKYLALQAKLDYEVSSGQLIEKSVVEKILFERARQFRDGVTATSKRIAPFVVGKESLKEIESLIDTELTYMLDQFSKLPVIE